MTISELAAEAAKHFTTSTRDDGTEFVKTTADTPDWIKELALQAHDEAGMFPDDWRYQAIRDVLRSISDHDAEDEDDLEDDRGEILDGLVDVYTHDLTAWLHSRTDRYTYCDDFAEEFGVVDSGDTLKRLSGGQYMEYQEILDSVVRSLSEQLEALDEDLEEAEEEAEATP